MIQVFKKVIWFICYFFQFENNILDSYLIRLHFVTVYILLFGSFNILLSRYLGSSIECLNSQSDLSVQILENYCLTEGALSLPDPKLAPVAFPGIRPYPVQKHDNSSHFEYYHWTCLVLIVQAIIFYLPKLLWNQVELINLIKKLNSWPINERNKYDRICLTQEVADTFTISSQYYFSMIYSHLFYILNLIFQIWFTNIFLSSNFLHLGSKWLEYIERYDSIEEDPLVRVFPRMAKCSFHKFGFSGTFEVKNTLCFLPLNVVNEKLFIILWFWYFVLLTFTFFYMFHDFSFFASSNFRLHRLQNTAPNVNPYFLRKISENVFHSFVLELIAVNMKPSQFNHLVTFLIKDHFDQNYNHLNKSVFGFSLSNKMFKPSLSSYYCLVKSECHCNL